MGSGAALPGLPAAAFAFPPPGRVTYEVAAGQTQEPAPEHHIRFGVIGAAHNHIHIITRTLRAGGGELVAVHGEQSPDMAELIRRNPGVKIARSEEEILDDPSIQLIASAAIPDRRAPIGIRAMRRGKDFLSDKPAVVSFEQLAEVRRAIKETGRIFGILYSERLECRASVHAGELVKAGAIGRVIQTINIAPHHIGGGRPEWFWDPERYYGGILVDIGSHQAEEFLYYTGSTSAEVVSSQVANINHPDRPKFQDFGDMTLHGNRGFGYVRVDWFTPNGLKTWGDGRLFILGTDGYMELRKYIDIAGHPGGNHLFVVDSKETRYIDCSKVALPFGRQFVADVVNRTHTAQDQEEALLAAELVLRAQKNAKAV